MQFSTLFLISLFSISMALTGCVGSDNSSAPTKPNQPTNPDTNNPNDNTDGDNSSGDGGDNGSGDNPGSGNNGSNEGSNGNGSGDGSTGGNTTPDPVSCNAPDTSIMDTSFGDVGDANKYNIDNYTEVTGTPDLSGTWVVIGDTSFVGTDLKNPSTHITQKYFFVIKNTADANVYQVANCSGTVIKEDLTVCVNDEKKIVNCETGGNEIIVGKNYKVWNGYLNKSVEDNTIALPVSLASELTFEINSNAYLTTTDKKYLAKKISADTNKLGTLDLISSKQNQTTKKVYYEKLTEQELVSYKTGNKYNDIEPLVKAGVSGYSYIDLPDETNKTIKQSSEYKDKELTCITQQVMHTRQCTAKNSETTAKTSTLTAISVTSTESYHLLFAAEQDTDNNLLAVQNQVVKSGKTTEIADAGSSLTMYDDIRFAKTKTDTAKDMKLIFTAETLNKDTDKSYQTGFKSLCSATEANFLSSSGGDCDEKDKKIYKTLLETTYTIVERKADVKLAPDSTRVK